MIIGFIRHWAGRFRNQHEGECVGYQEDDDDNDEAEEVLERATY